MTIWTILWVQELLKECLSIALVAVLDILGLGGDLLLCGFILLA